MDLDAQRIGVKITFQGLRFQHPEEWLTLNGTEFAEEWHLKFWLLGERLSSGFAREVEDLEYLLNEGATCSQAFCA